MSGTDTMTRERLNRFLSQRGVASRRKADALIAAGRVTINGEKGLVGAVVDADVDRVAVDGAVITATTRQYTVVMNKPMGYVTTRHDPEGRPTVMDLLKEVPDKRGLFPVGRLDANSRGLLLLTTDGELAHRLSHPRFGVLKSYRVQVEEAVEEAHLTRLRNGMELDGVFARPRNVERHGKSTHIFDVVMGEGRKREVRRLAKGAGLTVSDLQRWRYGPLSLDATPEGTARELTRSELGSLYAAVELSPPSE